VTPAPLPLAPRPNPGEAITSWVGRIAARYDIMAHDLVRHVLGRRSVSMDRVERLDYQADQELEAALAAAARVSPARVKALRIVCDDGSACCWHRTWPAWCRDCVQADLAQGGEVYERAVWRLGSCMACPQHRTLLEDMCRRCLAGSFCRFDVRDGLSVLACGACRQQVDPDIVAAREPPWRNEGAFGVAITPLLARLVADLQCDLQAALAATRPKRSWGHVRSAEGLLMVIMHLTLCVVMSTRVKCEQRIVLPDPRPGQAFVPVYKPITPATVSQSAAHGVLAIAAAVLGSLEGKGGPRHQWRPDGASLFLDASSFVGWLPPSRRESLKALAGSWEAPAGEALRTIVDATRVGDGLRH